MSSCGKRHNILILENELGMGGLEKKLFDLVSRIDSDHFRVSVCCLKRGGYWKESFVDLGVPFYEGLLKHKFDVLAYPRLLRVLKKEKIDLICLAGYMKLLSPEFVDEFKGKIINIHPALLPSFPGLHVQKKALEYGVKYSGATVHFVDEDCDTGPIIIQAVVPVKDDDTEETLSARILEQEHKIYPEAIKMIAEGKLRLEGRRVIRAKE